MKKLFVFVLTLHAFVCGCAQVNPQTGSATFGLPIFNWQDNKSRLNTTVALNYNSGNGLKVNDLASNVGQGWNLIAGGVITRMQIGEPDDQKPYTTSGTDVYSDIKKYPAGYLYSTLDIAKGVSSSVTQYPIFKDKNILYKQHNEVAADKELDRFAFQFNGRSGIFILDKNTNKGVSLEDSRIKIWFVRNENNASLQIRTTIIAFYIQDENGLIYKFTKYGTTKILKTSYCNPDQNGILTQPSFKNNKVYHETSKEDAQIVNPNIINEWHLEQIEDALTLRKINLTYEIRTIDANAGTALTHYWEQGVKEYTIVSNLKSKTQTPELSTIIYPDGHQVILNYGKNRIDLNGGKSMSSIDIKYLGRFICKYEFTTSYFITNRIGTPVSNYQKSVARLCLQSLKKIGVDLKADEPPYLFNYYLGSSITGDIIPAPFSHLKDIWGFYNADNSRDYNNGAIPLTQPLVELSNTQLSGLCFLRHNQPAIALNAKPGYAKNGLLKEINYPTGGAMRYEYEQNTAVLNGQSTSSNVGGVHVSKTTVTDGGFSNDCNNPITTNYTYNADASNTQSSLWGMEMPVNAITVSSSYVPASKYFYWKPVANMGCKYRYTHPGILTRDQAIDLTGLQKFMQSLSGVMDVITAASQVFDIISVCMHASPAAVIAIILDVIISIVNIILTCTSDVSKNSNTTLFYNSDINGSNALPSQFKRVEITESNGTNGKTIMEFTNPVDYPVWEPFNPTFSMKQRFAPWAYGLQKKVLVYNSANQIVKETINNYTYDYAKMQHLDWGAGHAFWQKYPSCKYLTLSNTSKRSDEWANPSNYLYPDTYTSQSNSSMLVTVYGIYSGRVLLTSTEEKNYKPGTPNFLTTNTQYSYTEYFLPSQIKTNNSDGTVTANYISYNSYLNNLMFLPSESQTLRAPNISTQLKPVKTVSTEYIYTATGDIKPSKILEKRYTEPGIPLNPPSIETQTFTYDALGNLKGQKDEANRTVTNIYDYDDKYVVASVVNADPVNDKCAYSSFETTYFGGWTLTGGTPVYSTANFITGLRSFTLVAGKSLSASLTLLKPYKISFWSTAPLTLSAGATLVKSSPLISGFTFYEYNITATTASISITGAANIDELRLTPKTSRIRTVTYDPVIGKTSECDENNRITYYEYDAIGRLRFVKDDKRNIVKMYEYNIAKKSPCPITYTNLKVSEIYTRNNCTANFIGSEVTYTIAAGTYSSTFSQAAVDVQVENDLNTNGQNYANTTGTCIPVYFNVALSGNFTKEDCALGYIGTTITYSVPAQKYRSLINQANANEQAQDEIDANGQAFANTPGNASCIINYEGVWEGTGLEQCTNGHKFKQVKDLNPNSSTYNQLQWKDTGLDATCPSGGCSNCTAPNQRCINNVCEIGVRVDEQIHSRCYYHYEWSDGYHSSNYEYPIGPNGCIVPIE